MKFIPNEPNENKSHCEVIDIRDENIQNKKRTNNKKSTKNTLERLRNQRSTLLVPPDVYTSVKEIWIVNVLLLENFLLKFLSTPEPFRRKDALGWVW